LGRRRQTISLDQVYKEDGDMNQEMRNNRHPSLLVGAVLGGLTSLPLVALSYLGAQVATLPFVPFDLFDWLARVLPGNVITVGIDSMVRVITLLGLGSIDTTAKSLEQAMGIILVIAGGVVLGILLAWGIRRTAWKGSTIGAILGLLVFLVVAGVEVSLRSASSGADLGALIWLAILFIGWGWLLGSWLSIPVLAAVPAAVSDDFRMSRRAMLIKLAGGSVGLTIVATGLGRLLEVQREASGAGQALSSLTSPTPQPGSSSISAAPTVGPTPPLAPSETAVATVRDRVPPAPGTRPELTANKDFYRIDIDALPPVLDKATWQLQVSGLFDRPRALKLDDLLAYPAVTQPITQGCISNPIAGDLISTTNYTGPRVRDVLKDLGMRPQATALYIKGADGFYETVGMDDLLDPRTLFVYGMNVETLPIEHGFPLRIYIPNRYGMKQPKWIRSIEAIDHNASGYWVDRGWSATAFPQIVSVIDVVVKDQVENGRVPIGGIAWAGDRGIKKVEVQVDGGDWSEAVLRVPPLSPLTWVQWRYDWPLVRGAHTFRVRATDGTGALQIEKVQDTYPDGATGYHAVTVTL
jgi:DMSO/TMAO reductase YedYZ molybdopterin-dependent catalytic subunit